MADTISFEGFLRADLRVGTVRGAEPNSKARKAAVGLRSDFGPLGLRTSSAQVTERYTAADLVGRQVVAVVNVPPKRVIENAKQRLRRYDETTA